jgi:hypothetical protein
MCDLEGLEQSVRLRLSAEFEEAQRWLEAFK